LKYFENDYLGGVKKDKEGNPAFCGTQNRGIQVRNTNGRFCPRPLPPSVTSEVRPMIQPPAWLLHQLNQKHVT